MKNLWTAACVAALVAAGCGPAINLSERPLFQYGVNTITFLVFDAFTGAPIEDATITINVGTYSFTATKTTGNAYVASQLPFGTQLATVESPGHIGFFGQPSGDCNASPTTGGPLSSPSSQCYKTYQVPLYPSTGVTDDVKVRVFESDKGAPVTTGTVVATLTNQSNVGTNFSNQLPGSLTLRPSTITAQLDSTGSATLPKDQLVLGGTYSVDIFGAKGTGGTYLAPAQNQNFVAGQTFGQLTVFMGPPAEVPTATSANNENGIGTKNGNQHAALVVTFPFPVENCNATGSTPGWTRFSGTDVSGDGTLAAPPATNQVNVSFNPAGDTLTLSPNYDTANNGTLQPADGPIVVQFNNMKVRVKGASTCQSLFSTQLRGNGPFISPLLLVADAP